MRNGIRIRKENETDVKPEITVIMEIVNIEARTFEAMLSAFRTFADRLDTLCRLYGDMEEKKWLDNQEVCLLLKVSPRTLQTLRDNGTLAYTQICHKTYYTNVEQKKDQVMMNTDNRLLTRESSEHIREFFSTVERLSVSMERLFAGRSPAMAGENFYTDRELAEKLKVSRRSLQQYRDSGLLAFTRLGGKILYRSSDIEKLLDGCYREARTRPEEL